MEKPQITTFKNGLRLIVAPMPQVESLTVLVGVGAGSRFETKQVNGLFHFIEHMAFKGTRKRPSTLDIAQEVDAVGGQLNAFTEQEFTSYFIKLAAKHRGLAFDILSDMLVNSLFKKEEIERERGVVIEEINLYKDTPTRRVWEVFIRLLYGDNPMGWDVVGKKETVAKIKREDFVRCINQLYFPKNIVVAVAGKISPKKAKQLTRQYFSQLKRKGKKRAKNIKLSQKRSKIKLAFKKTEQAHFCLGVPGYELGHADRYAMGILATILGGGMSSRLFTQVRERRGLAYYVDCNPDFFTDSGYLVARAGVRLANVQEAIKVVLSEFTVLRTRLIPREELRKAKEFNKGRLILALEDSFKTAGRYAHQALLEKKLRTPAETMKLIDKVTVGDVQRVAKDIFQPEKWNLAVIGPYKDKSRFKKLLNF